jgi:ATP-dependent Clp protease ATP-binding subunit ClpC
MFERFTDRARHVVVLAQDEARLLKHPSIGTEHLLLGLLREDDGLAVQVLLAAGAAPGDIRTQVLARVRAGQQAPSGHIPFTPQAKKALELSLRESMQLGDDYIGTEHLLLGLAREEHGVASQVLTAQNTGLIVIRREVSRLRSSDTEPEPMPPGALTGGSRAASERVSRVALAGQNARLDEALSRLDAIIERLAAVEAAVERITGAAQAGHTRDAGEAVQQAWEAAEAAERTGEPDEPGAEPTGSVAEPGG